MRLISANRILDSLGVCFCVCVMVAGVARADFSPGVTRNLTLVHDGYTRLYDVYVPPGYDGSVPVPLVVDLHGFTSSKTYQRMHWGVWGFRAVAKAEGFIVAYPLGLFGHPHDPEAIWISHGPSWNPGEISRGKALAENIDDVGFIRAMVAEIVAAGNIGERRIYATGWSQGGQMTQRLACEAADLFAAVAPVAGLFPFDPPAKCQPSRPIPVIDFRGLTDQVSPYEGLSEYPQTGAQASFEFWRDTNGCAGTSPDIVFDTGLYSYCERYNQCDDGVVVELCSVTGWGGSHRLYVNYDGLNIAQRAWDLMSQFSLNTPPDCSGAFPSLGEMWPPNHDFHEVFIEGATDPDRDPITIAITEIFQDDQLDELGTGNTCPDADGVGTDMALLRSERSGTSNGRVYHIGFRAEDGHGGECTGTVSICHPHDQGQGDECIDEGPLYDSTGPCDPNNDADADALLDTEEVIVGTHLLNPDSDGDGVTDGTDNCAVHSNPPGTYPAYRTTTGGQLDDDADGYGNVCDAKFTPGPVVTALDTIQYKTAINKPVTNMNCGTSGTDHCDQFDLDGAGPVITALDTIRFKQLLNQPVGPKCPICPLECVGDACP